MYVALDKNNYLDKIQGIHDDDPKFQQITSNPLLVAQDWPKQDN